MYYLNSRYILKPWHQQDIFYFFTTSDLIVGYTKTGARELCPNDNMCKILCLFQIKISVKRRSNAIVAPVAATYVKETVHLRKICIF